MEPKSESKLVDLTVDDLIPEIQALRAELDELKALVKVHTHDQHGAAVIRL